MICSANDTDILLQKKDSSLWNDFIDNYTLVGLDSRDNIYADFAKFVNFSIVLKAAANKAAISTNRLGKLLTTGIFSIVYTWKVKERDQQFKHAITKSSLEGVKGYMNFLDSNIANYVLTRKSPKVKYNKLLYLPRTDE